MTLSTSRWTVEPLRLLDCCQETDDLTALPEAAAARRLWRTSGPGPADIDAGILYDHFTPEEYGLCGRGEAAGFVAADRLPLNPHGGRLGEAYLHGMNGTAEAVRQVRGTSVNQVPGAGHVLVTAGTDVPTSALVLAPDR